MYDENDKELDRQLDDLDPQKLVDFAIKQGWTEFRVKTKNLRVFQLWEGDEYFQVRIPFDRRFSDYKRALFTACQSLAKRAGVRFTSTEYNFNFLK